MGFGIPAAETLAQRISDELHKYLLNGALLCVVLSVVFTMLTTLMAAPLLRLIHTPGAVTDAALYIRLIFLGIPATVLYNYASSVLRRWGFPAPFYFLLVASVVNILLDYLFIVPLGMGVDGAAIATVLSQLLSGGLCAYWFFTCTAKLEGLSFRSRAPCFRQGTASGWPTSAFPWGLNTRSRPSVQSSCRTPSICWAAPLWQPRPQAKRSVRCSPCPWRA